MDNHLDLIFRRLSTFICLNGGCFDVGTCLQFMAAWESKYENCCTCIKWNRDDLVCMDPAEVVKRRRESELRVINKMIRGNKPIRGPL